MHDIYTEITQRIVTALEAGTPPWSRPWSGEADPTPDECRRRPYRGVNFLTLTIEAQAHGYTRNRWLTYRQAAALGGQVRKGEHGTPVVFWKLRKVEDRPTDPRVIPLLRCYTVFNTAQIEGLPSALAEPLPQRARLAERRSRRGALIEASGADIRHAGFKAFYAPGGDYIQIPPRVTFASPAGYYAMTLHELTHWTAHTSGWNGSSRALRGRGDAAEEAHRRDGRGVPVRALSDRR